MGFITNEFTTICGRCLDFFSPNKQILRKSLGIFFVGEKNGDIDIVNTSTIHTASFQNGGFGAGGGGGHGSG